MQDLGTELSKGLVPIILALISGLGIAILAKLTAWMNGEKTAKAISEAVVTAAKMPLANEDKLALVMAAVPKATEAAVEVQVAKLIKPIQESTQ